MVSAIGGMFGSSAVGLGRLCPMARRRPELTCAITAAAGVSVHWDSLAMTEATDGPPPLYGTCRESIWAACWKYAPERWLCDPAPADAMLNLPLLARE